MPHALLGGAVLAASPANWRDGAALIERALGLNPNLAWAWHFSGFTKAYLGEPETAIEHAARAMRLSPQDPQIFAMQTATALAHFFAGRDDEALSMGGNGGAGAAELPRRVMHGRGERARSPAGPGGGGSNGPPSPDQSRASPLQSRRDLIPLRRPRISTAGPTACERPASGVAHVVLHPVPTLLPLLTRRSSSRNWSWGTELRAPRRRGTRKAAATRRADRK